MNRSRARVACLGVLFSLSLALSMRAVAHAEAPAEPSAALRARVIDLLKKGAAHMNAGDYAEALARYEEAFGLIPSPKIQYNIGTAYDGLARYAQAYDAYEAFLKGTKNAAPEFVARAEARLGALALKLGTLVIIPDRPPSSLHVDGRSVDPSHLTFKLEPGEHTVAGRSGEQSSWQTVTLTAGEVRRLHLQFAPTGPQPEAPKHVEVPGRRDALALSRKAHLVAEPPPAPSRPLYARPWVLVGAAAVVAGAVATAVLLSSRTNYPAVDRTITW